MYINAKKHLLSKAIMKVAFIKVIAAFLEAVLRILVKRRSWAPDMMDIFLWHTQVALSAIQIFVVALIFWGAHRKLKHYMSLVPEEDRRQMEFLQEEAIGKNVSSLSIASINRLLQLWTVIFVGAELVYSFISIMYRRFIGLLMDALSSGEGMTDGTFVIIYNMTHGFKYIEIMAAILLGVVMTGIFLNDRFLKFMSLVILVIFLVSFGFIEMQTVSFMGREIGVVWTSIICHATETGGLFLLACYLAIRYKGL